MSSFSRPDYSEQCEYHPELMQHLGEVKTDIKWIKEKLGSKSSWIAPGVMVVLLLTVFGYLITLSGQVSKYEVQLNAHLDQKTAGKGK